MRMLDGRSERFHPEGNPRRIVSRSWLISSGGGAFRLDRVQAKLDAEQEMKRFFALMAGCATLAVTACGDAGEDPKPMELGPDMAKAECAATIEQAWAESRSALCIAPLSG
jgi:hypothetical protein